MLLPVQARPPRRPVRLAEPPALGRVGEGLYEV